MKGKIKKEIILIINEIAESKISQETGKIDIDSLRFMEVVVALEKKFKIKIEQKHLPAMMSLDGIIKTVEKLLKKEK